MAGWLGVARWRGGEVARWRGGQEGNVRRSEKQKAPSGVARRGLQRKGWRRPTLPPSRDGSTIGAAGLNCRVRNGNGCGPCALVVSRS